jgi:hypothetical protein
LQDYLLAEAQHRKENEKWCDFEQTCRRMNGGKAPWISQAS